MWFRPDGSVAILRAVPKAREASGLGPVKTTVELPRDLWRSAKIRAMDERVDLRSLHARCSIAKLYASEAANRIADRVVQILGGRGYMRENAAERFYRELRVDRIWEGASEVQRLIIARALLKRGLEGM